MRFVLDLDTPRVVFGQGTLEQTGTEVEALGGTRAMLIAGAHATDARSQLVDALDSTLVGVFDEVVEHVPVDVARRAIERAGSLGADLIIALGGGSAIGTAKAVALTTGTPVLAIPTTFAGSEMTSIWGMTEHGAKRTGRDAKVRPRTVIYDTDLVRSLPQRLASLSGMNALAHCVEAVYSPDVSPLVRMAAVEGAGALLSALDSASADGRATLFYGSCLAGLALNNSTMGLHHKLAHVLGGQQNLPHAGLHSVLLPYVVAYNAFAARDQLRPLMKLVATPDLAGEIWTLGRKVGNARGLAQIGFDEALTDDVVRAVLANPPINPRPVDETSLRELLAAAAQGAAPTEMQFMP